MKVKRSRLALLGVLAVAVGVFAGPGVAHGAKVSETAAGGPVPDAVSSGGILFQTPFVQEFKLKGSKVKGKQVLDVNLIMNSSGSAADALQELTPVLVAPKGQTVLVLVPGIGHNQVNVKYDDQSELIPCNPLVNNRRDCNYMSGADASGDFGTFTGSLNAGAGGVLVGFNATFRGLNPKGTWTLYTYDDEVGAPNNTLGETTLEVKTGKKFAKED